MTFKVGDEVEWTSQAGGWTRTKRGEVIEVVPAESYPMKAPRGSGFPRKVESYVVRATALGRSSNARRATYWPHASLLRPVAPRSGGNG